MPRAQKLTWSCDERVRDRQACRNPYGCHCAEITALTEQLRQQTARVASLEAAQATGRTNYVPRTPAISPSTPPPKPRR